MREWLLWLAACALIVAAGGCATRLSLEGQPTLQQEAGYDHSGERDRHNFRVETIKNYDEIDLRKPLNTVRECYLFCTLSHTVYVWGPYGRNSFSKWRWQPSGISQFCDPIDPDKRPWGVEWYFDTKIEGNISKEMRVMGKGDVIEYAPVEQFSFRIKNDAEPCANSLNMAGAGG